MDFEKRDDVTMPEYMNMIGLKTGVLLACSAQMGALIAGANMPSQEAIYEYGYYLGLAFQVADDYLDAYGDEKVFGKPIGGEKGAAGLTEALNDTTLPPAEKIARVKAIYDSVDIVSEAKKAISDLSTRAVFKGTDAAMGAEGHEALKQFAHSLVGRTM